MTQTWLKPEVNRPVTGLDVVRVAASLIMLIHGCTRLYLQGVPVFGTWLAAQGVPAGVAVAGCVTAFEIVGAAALLARRAVVPVCLGFLVTLGCGVALVHAREGWFVVGAGRNGMEFSALLLANFAGLAWAHWPKGGSEPQEA